MPFGNQFAATFNSGSAPAPVIPTPSFGSTWAPPADLPGTGTSYAPTSSSAPFASAPTSNNYPVPGAQNLTTAGNNPDPYIYPGSSVVNTTRGGGGFHVPFLPFGFGSGGSPPTDTPWSGNAGQPPPPHAGFLQRLFGAVPAAIGSVAHLGSRGIGSLLNRHGQPDTSAPSFPSFGGGFAPIGGEHSIAGGGTPGSIDPRTGQPIYTPLGYGQFPGAAPPVSSAGTPGQLAGNQQTSFQTGFQNMQAASNPVFYKPDELTAGRGPTPSGPAPGTVAYRQAYPSGSTNADLLAFNAKIASGAIPTFQQFLGKPAYKPPTAAAAPKSPGK